MIAFPHCRTLLFTPPRTASATLHRVLCAAPFHGICVYGPAGDDSRPHYNQHTTVIDPDHAGWRRAVVVRDELDRLVSLWHYATSYAARVGCGFGSFREFVKLALDDNKVIQHWTCRWTIRRWAKPLEPYREIRFTHLADDLTDLLGIPVESELLSIHEHRSDRGETASYFTDPEVRKWAEQWAKS